MGRDQICITGREISENESERIASRIIAGKLRIIVRASHGEQASFILCATSLALGIGLFLISIERTSQRSSYTLARNFSSLVLDHYAGERATINFFLFKSYHPLIYV